MEQPTVRPIEHSTPAFVAARERVADAYRAMTGQDGDVVVDLEPHELGSWVRAYVRAAGRKATGMMVQAVSDETVPHCAVFVLHELAAHLEARAAAMAS